MFFGGDPFGRDLGYLASLVADGKLDPQLGAELPWEEITEAMDRLQSRDVAGKVALTLGGPASRASVDVLQLGHYEVVR